jgi:hypothetical protein
MKTKNVPDSLPGPGNGLKSNAKQRGQMLKINIICFNFLKLKATLFIKPLESMIFGFSTKRETKLSKEIKITNLNETELPNCRNSTFRKLIQKLTNIKPSILFLFLLFQTSNLNSQL